MNHLRKYRTQAGWSQGQLARESGVSQATVSFIESGLVNPIDLTQARLGKALGVDPDKIFPLQIRGVTHVT